MELSEALQQVRSLLAFHQGLKHLEDVLEASSGAHAMHAELTKAIELVRRKHEEISTEFLHAKEAAEHEMAAIKAAVAAAKEQHRKVLEGFADKQAKAEAATVAAIAVARTKQAEAEHEVEEVVKFLETKKADLESKIAALEDHFESLRQKAANF